MLAIRTEGEGSGHKGCNKHDGGHTVTARQFVSGPPCKFQELSSSAMQFRSRLVAWAGVTAATCVSKLQVSISAMTRV